MFKWSKYDCIVLPTTLVVILLLSFLFRFLLKKQKVWVKKLPLQVLSVFVVFLEISKQIYYGFYSEFTYYVLPLHFCSLFILLMPLSQLFGEKIGRVFKPMFVIYAIIMMVILYVNPYSVIGNSCSSVFGSFHNCHTFFFHFSIIFYLFLSIFIGDYVPRKTDWINLSAGVLFYASYAIPCAFALNTNYVNILYSYFIPFEKIRLACGQLFYDIMLFLFSMIVIVLIFWIYYKIYYLIEKYQRKKTNDFVSIMIYNHIFDKQKN